MAGRPIKDGVNVQVILRCRPFSRSEQLRADANRNFVLCKEDNKEVLVSQNVGGGKLLERSFHFDKVFGPDSGQERLYNQAIAPIVEEVLEGFNCTIFAYGQTGTGKTYTMEGGDRDSEDGTNLSDVAGVIPRAIHHIFTTLDRNDSEYTVKCSFLELYNEETTDLLAVGERMDQKLRIMEDRSGVVIQGLEEFIVKSSTDIYALLDRGSSKRKVAETMLNKQSSRSHGVFCITVHMREIAADGEEVIKIGKLYLVDLAGSENVSRSGAAGTMAKEAGSINKSLLTLGRVITALVEGSGHIPYRDSKLTRLLRDSLGGKTKTCIIATIAPTAHCQDETLSTLDYAHRAKNIRNKPEVNQKISKTAHIKELNAEIDRLKAELFATREKNGIYVPADQYEQREENTKQSQVKIEVLEADIEALTLKLKLAAEKAAQEVAVLQQELKETTNAYQRAKLGIQERDFLIATHRRSEAAILNQSEQLTQELRTANAAIDDMQAMLEERAQREQSNAAVVQNICQQSQQACWSLQSMCAQFSQDVQTRFQQAKSAVQDREASRLQSAEKFNLDATCLLAQLRAVVEASSGDAAAICKALTDGLDELKSQSNDFTSVFAAEVQQADRQISESFAGMEQAGQAHQAEVTANLAQQAQASAKLLAIAQETSTQASEHLQACCNSATDHFSALQQKLQAQQAGLTAFRNDFMQQLSSEVDQVMMTIQGAMEGFVARKCEEISITPCLTGEEQIEMHAQLDVAKQSMNEAMTKSSDLKNLGIMANGAHRELVAGQAHLANLHRDHSTLASSRCEQLHASIQSSLKHNMRAVEQHTQATELSSGRSVEIAAQQIENATKSCISGIQEAQEQCERIQSAHQAEQAVEKEAATQWSYAAEQAAITSQSYSTQANTNMGEVATNIQKRMENNFAQDPDAGIIPQRALLAIPAADWIHAVRMPPAETLLAEFRRQRETTLAPDDCALKERTYTGNEQGSGVKAEKQTPPEGLQTRSDNSGEENVDPNQEVKDVSQKSVSKPRLVKEQTNAEGDIRAVEVSRHKKRLRQ